MLNLLRSCKNVTSRHLLHSLQNRSRVSNRLYLTRCILLLALLGETSPLINCQEDAANCVLHLVECMECLTFSRGIPKWRLSPHLPDYHALSVLRIYAIRLHKQHVHVVGKAYGTIHIQGTSKKPITFTELMTPKAGRSYGTKFGTSNPEITLEMP